MKLRVAPTLVPAAVSLATRWRAAAESGADDGLIRAVEGGEGAERVRERAFR